MTIRTSATAALALLLCQLLGGSLHGKKVSPPWHSGPGENELSFTATIDQGVRIHVNAPPGTNGRPARGTLLVVYALPNGNTIEQTLGCRITPGLDWHFDIQHVAAQVRMLRSILTDERIVLICAEAPGLSWPSFRSNVPDANSKIRALVSDWRKEHGTRNSRVLLTGHSGGGAFLFGVIDGGDKIPAYIDRIAFLDANYSYDTTLHAGKLEHWLRGGADRRLIVLAYDDREITLNGKKVVGPTGGTFRATERMREGLGNRIELTERETLPFSETLALDGRLRFYVHPNPENKILHTALVGEMNGLVHVATLGTADEGTWGHFGGPRAYSQYVQAEPTPKSPITESKNLRSDVRNLPPSRTTAEVMIPARKQDAIGGAAFMKNAERLNLEDREAAIFREIVGGNIPDFLRTFIAVPVRGIVQNRATQREITTTLHVMPDYLAVGSNEDFARIPMTPQTAQRIADALGCVLPTRKLVDAIDAAATVRIAPHPLTKDRESVATFYEHHQIVEQQREERPLGALITGIKKDVVLTPRIFERPRRLAIYGWRQLDGRPIQPLTIVHADHYVDYSHGVRLIRNVIEVEGEQFKVDELLADPERSTIVSDEGPMDPPRYPLE